MYKNMSTKHVLNGQTDKVWQYSMPQGKTATVIAEKHTIAHQKQERGGGGGGGIPRHLLTIDEADILKKVVLHSVATAFASIV
jgi:hypothetical protein